MDWSTRKERGNRDKKIVMVKVNNIGKNRYSNNKKFSLLGKSPGLISLASNPSVGTGYSGFVGKGAALLLDSLG
jgi:hypothetical protein